MTPYEPTRRLAVTRILADGSRVAVGNLAQNRQGVYFAYDPAYLQQHGNLSPYHLRADSSVQPAPRDLPHGLHGEHMTAFGGYGKASPLKTPQKLASQASFVLT